MRITHFNNSIDIWIEALKHYNLNTLLIKPSPKSWSLGQLYQHLIDDTDYYIEQIKICILNNDNADKEASPFAKNMFINNSFPNARLAGAPGNDTIPQPIGKENLLNNLIRLKNEMNVLAEVISSTLFKGKTKHPGFEYFDADAWLQFADMHFRHHLKQKKRIDDFLRDGNAF